MSAAAISALAAAVPPQLGVTAPSSAYGSVSSFSPGARTVNSNSITATAQNGTAPYSYSWARISGSTAISATAASSATTAFTASLNIGQAVTAVFRVTTTDSGGSPAASADVTVTLENQDLR